MRGMFMVCLSLSLVAKPSAAAEVATPQEALTLACSNAEAEDHAVGKKHQARQDCEASSEVTDNGHGFWIVAPKQHSYGFEYQSVRKSDGTVVTAVVN